MVSIVPERVELSSSAYKADALTVELRYNNLSLRARPLHQCPEAYSDNGKQICGSQPDFTRSSLDPLLGS